MAERKVYDCDGCDKQGVEIRHIVLETDRRMDAAGSSENIHESIDLCIDCLAKSFRFFFPRNERRWTVARNFLDYIKGKKWQFFWSPYD